MEEEEFIECLKSYMKESTERHYDEYLIDIDLKQLVHDFYVKIYQHCEDNLRYEIEEEIEQRYNDEEYM